MKVIQPSATIMEHNVTPYQFIEKVGRTCYKSEDRITENSAEKFVKGLVKRQHWAMLEHETIYLVVSEEFMCDFLVDMQDYQDELKYFNITSERYVNIISGSFRSFHDLFERGHSSHLINFIKMGMQFTFPLVYGECDNEHFRTNKVYYGKDSCTLYTRQEFINGFHDKPEILFKHLTHTIKFVCDRGVSHEFVRHRPCSFAQESTRYCNYSLDKFGDEITVIEPCFFEKGSPLYNVWSNNCLDTESNYFSLLNNGATPQEARSVLPNSLKTELIITATEEEWQHIVDLRYLGKTGAPHPQMKEVMSLAIKDLVEESCGRIVS